ncbi:hypothetical protein [Marinoscillum furvescens]|uniref:Uncharacterized protein n=1 Tax=Marinoscillum furvescens DSM 4134 TaxID=1122208 RepID=A0A3D9L7I1_MARFU|nr:hypothetical protein [Marinoscillum furvescens]REE00447.1 hypothetical protein C7460_10568 [Marinoscillum furvescens DSM 4134]
MPANKKYLSASFHQRLAKITSGLIGGYMLTSLLFMLAGHWIPVGPVLITLKFAGFVLWCGLLIVPFLFKNGWTAWGIYLFGVLVLAAICYALN